MTLSGKRMGLQEAARRGPLSAEIDMEPSIAAILDRKAANWRPDPHVVRSEAQVAEALATFMREEAPDSTVTDVHRLGGGGSNEQFVFGLRRDGTTTRYVLRLDPTQASVQTDRQREFEVLRHFAGKVPAPRAAWVDPDGSRLGSPALITAFVDGVVKPSSVGSNVSGLGIMIGDRLRTSLSQDFLDCLAAIHGSDWRTADLPSYQGPTADPHQAARWQVNWWRRVWHDDRVEPHPAMAAAEQWLLENLPACEPQDLVIVHDDYRTGNYLFDEGSGRITAILDWELAHIGDFHEDVAWVLIKPLNSVENGVTYMTSLYGRDEWLERYAARTGRRIDPVTLHFYEVLNNFKNAVITLATCVRAARDGHTHQDVHQTWVAAFGHQIEWEVCDLIERGPQP